MKIVDENYKLYHVIRQDNSTPLWAPVAGAVGGLLVAGPVGAIVGALGTYAGWPYLFGKKEGV